MSRNDLVLLLACAIMATILSGAPSPLTRSSPVTIASLISTDTMQVSGIDPALVQQSVLHQ